MADRPRASERRTTPRIPALGALRARSIAMNVPLSVRDLSRGGFAVEGPLAFATGTQHRFEFWTDRGQLTVLDAVVAHCMRVTNADGVLSFLTGFAFSEADEGANARVAALLDELHAAV
jgi:hypothetical protein